MKAVLAELIILKYCDARISGLQLLTTFMLIAKGTNREAKGHLNHMGVCQSYVQAWRRLTSIACDPRRLQNVIDEPCLWVYDNLNIFKGVRHERKDSQATMWNLTTRLVIPIKNMPEDSTQRDNRPQRSRSSLSASDILFDDEDGRSIIDDAVFLVMNFLTERVRCLAHLKGQLICTPPGNVTKTKVTALEILDVDEAYTDENIEILKRFCTDMQKTEPTSQVVAGDQKTCSNIRSAKVLREYETEKMHQLS
eukprot:m.34573 g.34573  ORF g.34573 m.34573 type:complete len:252 (+) comp31999_c0_seq2:517-1272(+)